MTNDTDLDIWPEEIRLHDNGARLAVTFENGEKYDYTAEFLRVTSPSAEVQGHHPSQRKTVPGKKDVTITKIEPSGNYAVKLKFSDGHDSGIYSWETLWELGTRYEEYWQDYLKRLEEAGYTRRTEPEF